MPLTQAQLATAVAARAELSNADAKRALAAVEEIILERLSDAEKVRIGGLVQLTVRVKPAQKKRKGRNPATGDEITIAAKPASVDLRARPLAKAKARFYVKGDSLFAGFREVIDRPPGCAVGRESGVPLVVARCCRGLDRRRRRRSGVRRGRSGVELDWFGRAIPAVAAHRWWQRAGEWPGRIAIGRSS